jgi:hypothetical protein
MAQTTRRRRKKRKKGRGKLIFLLVLLVGVSTWNYQRNVAIEEAKPRPYRGYSDTELEQLRAAYDSQASALAGRYEQASAQRSGSRDVKLVAEGVEQFKQVQRASRAVRDLGAQLSQEEASLRAIEEEQALRAQLGGPVMTIVKRAFLF